MTSKNTLKAGNITGATVVVGNDNTTTNSQSKTQINIKAELSSLLSDLKTIGAMDDSKIASEADYIEAEVLKDDPDKATIGMSLSRITERLTSVNKLASEAEKIYPRLQAVAEWAGPYGEAALKAIGM